VIHSGDLRSLIIRPSCETIGLWSESAEVLLAGTLATESTIGTITRLRQVVGPALGPYQIEPATHLDVWTNFLRYRQPLGDKVRSLCPPDFLQADGIPEDAALIGCLPYATAIARLVYYRARPPLPAHGNLPALADYWKAHYNTAGGAGTPQKFLDACRAAGIQ
jgi:hypothetical protein